MSFSANSFCQYPRLQVELSEVPGTGKELNGVANAGNGILILVVRLFGFLKSMQTAYSSVFLPNNEDVG
ncbi:hypothetical protein DPMN_108343 [Dreissena polymorpha]|uniref:Uncharacterized protein n=1 Tax=Dreissena polymorpha TaxID=45954 RepID=A0A9D4QLX9_DREPO|nr:hypothetical protein DPMN_108343 [Dreissena polymorpha]